MPPWNRPKAPIMVVMGQGLKWRAATPQARLTVRQSMASATATNSVCISSISGRVGYMQKMRLNVPPRQELPYLP